MVTNNTDLRPAHSLRCRVVWVQRDTAGDEESDSIFVFDVAKDLADDLQKKV